MILIFLSLAYNIMQKSISFACLEGAWGLGNPPSGSVMVGPLEEMGREVEAGAWRYSFC